MIIYFYLFLYLCLYQTNSFHFANSFKMQIKNLQKTWFIMAKESPVGHVFCLKVLRGKEQGVRLKIQVNSWIERFNGKM